MECYTDIEHGKAPFGHINLSRPQNKLYAALEKRRKKLDASVTTHHKQIHQANQVCSSWKECLQSLRCYINDTNFDIRKLRKLNKGLITSIKHYLDSIDSVALRAMDCRKKNAALREIFDAHLKQRTIGKYTAKFSGLASSSGGKAGVEIQEAIADMKNKTETLNNERNLLLSDKQFLSSKLLSRDPEGRNLRADTRRRQELKEVQQQWEKLSSVVERYRQKEAEILEALNEETRMAGEIEKKLNKARTKYERGYKRRLSQMNLKQRLSGYISQYSEKLESLKVKQNQSIEDAKKEKNDIQLLKAQQENQSLELQELEDAVKLDVEENFSLVRALFDSCGPLVGKVQDMIRDNEEILEIMNVHEEGSSTSPPARDMYIIDDFDHIPVKLKNIITTAYEQMNHIVDDKTLNSQALRSFTETLRDYEEGLKTTLDAVDVEIKELHEEVAYNVSKNVDIERCVDRHLANNKVLRKRLCFKENEDEKQDASRAYLNALRIADDLLQYLKETTD